MNSTKGSLIVEAMTGVEIPWVKGLASMFYMVSPTDSSYRTVEEVPQFYRKAWPYFLLFILIENILLWVERKPLMRVNDGLTSLAHGLFQECGRLVFRGGEHALYVYIYDNFHIVDLRWESPVTWYIAAIGVDFCYYWVHRASHEVHILWAQHQVHHSSEDYNLAVGLRQSVLQGWCGFIFYLPMAFFVPPAQFLTHQQFNLLYQFWIHTETVKSLGPLEWLLNTPKHHRVHHGSVLYCLDKNYGGFLIVWDRLFGTFQEEKEKQEIIYGLVKHEPSFNPLYLQVFYNKNVLEKVRRMERWQDKVGAMVKGPSWLPGKPWTGADEDKIDVKSRIKYDVKLATWLNVYIVVHFALITVGFQELALRYVSMSPLTVLMCVCYILGALTILGMLLDADVRAPFWEVARCVLLLLLVHRCADALRDPILSPSLMTTIYLTSATFWTLRCLLGLKHIPHHRIG